MSDILGRNHLAGETSPYLKQHAANPVDWYPWGEEAFRKAREEDKPVFLSIGYSTCHWCHVMARESFEDPYLASLLNETFVNVKVDREERPDVDQAYLTVAQLLTGGAGWPLTVLLTPDREPFYAGTYIPRESRFGRIGLRELTEKVRRLWQTDRAELLEDARRIAREASRDFSRPGELSPALLDRGFQELLADFDELHGGFGGAPKFPTPHRLSFLLRHWRRTGDERARAMATKTLRAIRAGGISDQLGGGLHRYSTDAEWRVPHFEKMLYDQALLALALADAYLATGEADFRAHLSELFDYVFGSLRSPQGAFHAAEDADAGGEEGLFYLWTEAEIRSALGPEAEIFLRAFGVTRLGNLPDRPGANVLYRARGTEELAAEFGLGAEAVEASLAAGRRRLRTLRADRVRPFRDDKILTDWNGLMIAALARGSAVLGTEPLEGARRAADFVLSALRRPGGGLYHSHTAGRARVDGFLADCAFLVFGLLELYQASLEDRYLEAAWELNELQLAEFWDGERGGFFETSRDSEAVLGRRKEVYDGAVPSGNSVAFGNLLRLGNLTGESRLLDRAAELGRAFAATVAAGPSAFAEFLSAAELALFGMSELVLVGEADSAETRALWQAARDLFRPDLVLLLRPPTGGAADRLAPFTREFPFSGRATAYLCQNGACELPTDSPAELAARLTDRSRGEPPQGKDS